MRFILAASFAVIFFATAVNAETTGSNTTCTKPFNKIMLCNLMCNLLHDSQTYEAMKTVQTKLENLIAMVNKPSSGKWLYVLVHFQIQSVKRKEYAISVAWKIVLHFSEQEMNTPIKQRFFLQLKNCFMLSLISIFSTAVPVSSCKEQYEKYL